MGHYASEMGDGSTECKWTREFLLHTYCPMIEDERDRARAELAEVRAELAKAKATIEKQAEEINDLENREDILRINLADRDKARAELAEAKEVISRIRAVINEGGSAMSEYYMVVEIDGILAGCEEA